MYTKDKIVSEYGVDKKVKVLNVTKILVHALLAITVLTFVFGSFGTVSQGEIGIKTRFNKVVGTLSPGLYVKLPIFESVTKLDVQVQKEQADASAASKDLQTVSTKVAVNYQIDSSKIVDLYTRIGSEYKSKLIDPAIQEVVKAVTAKYTAEELITKRPEVTDEIQKQLSDKLALSDILVSTNGVSIVNFDFSAQFNQAIELKVTAEQNALAAKNKLDQVTYEGKQTVVSAQAQAEAIKIQAQAINSQGGADYVELQRIKTWDGHGCTSYCGLLSSTGLLINTK